MRTSSFIMRHMSQTRREFLAFLSAVPLASLGDRPDSADGLPGTMVVNGERLRRHLEGLSLFGRQADGTFASGVSRVGYSDADVAGRSYAMDLMRQAGIEPRVDAAGNILARRPGTDDSLAPLLFGSHIDSVPNGGNFDGDLGSLAAIEVIQTLRERNMTTRRPLEIVVWANEEGFAFGNGLCGSRAAAGQLVEGELDHVWNGGKKADAIRRIGGHPDRISEARRTPGSFACYLELHIEQGGTLDRAGIPIGVVEGIVSIDRYEVTIRGMANHAGTTPMPDRRDALIAASHVAIAVNEIVTSEPGRQVGTVGQLVVVPNAPNVIPGLVRHTIELRDLSADKIRRLADLVRSRARDIATRTKTTIEITHSSHHEGAMATPEIQAIIEKAAAAVSLPSQRMPSGAGHDAQMMATLGPMGMIFVPSVGGISHSPQELSRWEDCTRGAEVLLRSVLLLSR
ncbi:MAG: Zn-dependent hydrolase [Acidobacteria bacterium]|nr:Zn-dependent hydrolase [Acidobacteriota bacterium]